MRDRILPTIARAFPGIKWEHARLDTFIIAEPTDTANGRLAVWVVWLDGWYNSYEGGWYLTELGSGFKPVGKPFQWGSKDDYLSARGWVEGAGS